MFIASGISIPGTGVEQAARERRGEEHPLQGAAAAAAFFGEAPGIEARGGRRGGGRCTARAHARQGISPSFSSPDAAAPPPRHRGRGRPPGDSQAGRLGRAARRVGVLRARGALLEHRRGGRRLPPVGVARAVSVPQGPPRRPGAGGGGGGAHLVEVAGQVAHVALLRGGGPREGQCQREGERHLECGGGGWRGGAG